MNDTTNTDANANATANTTKYKKCTIYTDGSCLGNPGVGGYAGLILYPNGKQRVIKGSEPNTTNNRMEMAAIIETLKALKGNYEITIYSDSNITVNGIMSWLKNWIKKNFKNTANKDLWKEYIEVSKAHKVTAIWVKAHNGNEYNERVDDIAREEAIKCKRGL
jgi:ribonuclease HI